MEKALKLSGSSVKRSPSFYEWTFREFLGITREKERISAGFKVHDIDSEGPQKRRKKVGRTERKKMEREKKLLFYNGLIICGLPT